MGPSLPSRGGQLHARARCFHYQHELVHQLEYWMPRLPSHYFIFLPDNGMGPLPRKEVCSLTISDAALSYVATFQRQ